MLSRVIREYINKLKSNFKKDNKEKENVQGCLDIYSEMNVNLVIDSEKFLFTPFLIKQTNVEAYVELLDLFIERIRSNEVIKPEDIPDYSNSKSLEIFFTDKEGKYLDYNESLMLLKNAVLTLCHELILNREDIGVHEHNRRILSTVLVDLTELGVLINNK